VISRQGDLHGQYGRYVVARMDRDTSPELVGSNTPRATNVRYGVHEPNGECLYDIHQWPGVAIGSDRVVGGTMPAPTSAYRNYVQWTLGPNVRLYSAWAASNEGPGEFWIIDDRPEGEGWVYWGGALAVGQQTQDFLQSFRLIRQPNGEADYVIHVHT